MIDANLLNPRARMLAALKHAEAIMSIVPPRTAKAEYLAALADVRAAIAKANECEEPAEGWRDISTARRDGSEIWAYTREGYQRVVHWEAEQPSGPDDPGHDSGWMSDDGATHPSCFCYTQQNATDPPSHWRPLPSAPNAQEAVEDSKAPAHSRAVPIPPLKES